MTTSRTEATAILSQTLAGEYAAAYAYGVVGSHLDGTAKDRARRALVEHNILRDQLRTALTELGATPPAPAAAYKSPIDVTSPATANALAVLVESRLVRSWSAVAATLNGAARLSAARTAQQCAVRAISWGGPTSAFPGAS